MAPPTRSTDPSSGQDRLQHLEEQLQAVLDQQATLQTENDQLRDQVAGLTALPLAGEQDSDVNSHQHDLGTPAPMRGVSLVPTTTTSSGRVSEPKIASPEYYGGQRNKLPSFITQVTMVITLQASRFPTEISKIIYAGSFLRDTAFLWFQPYVTAEPQPSFMMSFKEFCKELQSTFGDPDEIGTAERQLYALRQRGSVASYMAEFMRFAVVIKWNDQAKAAQFYRGLKDGIKDELSRVGRPNTLKELEASAIRIDTRLFERQVEKGERFPSTNITSAAPSRFIPRNTSSFTKTQTTFPRPNSERLQAFQPINDKITRQGRLTPTEYQRRRDLDLCLYCGDKGHQVIKCPLAPVRKTASLQASKVSKKSFPLAGKD